MTICSGHHEQHELLLCIDGVMRISMQSLLSLNAVVVAQLSRSHQYQGCAACHTERCSALIYMCCVMGALMGDVQQPTNAWPRAPAQQPGMTSVSAPQGHPRKCKCAVVAACPLPWWVPPCAQAAAPGHEKPLLPWRLSHSSKCKRNQLALLMNIDVIKKQFLRNCMVLLTITKSSWG